jgi:hypothetical protein
VNTSSIARLLGRRGGLARGRRLSVEARRNIASAGGRARRESIEAARRIVTNLRYAETVRRLRRDPSRVVSRATATAPLPGLYPRRS